MSILPQYPAPRRALKTPVVPVGTQFSGWTVIGAPGVIPDPQKPRVGYPCRCVCGIGRWVLASHLRTGASRSCGCLKAAHTRQTVGERGNVEHPLYCRWQAMKSRCLRVTDPKYHCYGGRGIAIDSEWLTWDGFLRWAETSGFRPGLQLDRIDNNGPYAPGNCRWITHRQQMHNTRVNRLITAWGETKCKAEWRDDPRCVVHIDTALRRIDGGIAPEVAFTCTTQMRIR